MKMVKGLLAIGMAILISGCGEYKDRLNAENHAKYHDYVEVFNAKSIESPKVVGTTPDGQVITLTVLKYLCDTCSAEHQIRDHFIYSVGKVISDNAVVPRGKSTIIEPRVTFSN